MYVVHIPCTLAPAPSASGQPLRFWRFRIECEGVGDYGECRLMDPPRDFPGTIPGKCVDFFHKKDGRSEQPSGGGIERVQLNFESEYCMKIVFYTIFFVYKIIVFRWIV